MSKFFVGCFRFEEGKNNQGTFQIAANAPSLIGAENTFRKTLRDSVSTSVFESGTNIFLLDIIEISSFESGIMMNLTKQHKNSGIVYRPLPMKPNNTTSYSTGHIEAKEPFVTV